MKPSNIKKEIRSVCICFKMEKKNFWSFSSNIKTSLIHIFYMTLERKHTWILSLHSTLFL